MAIIPGDRGHVAEHNSIDARLDALEAGAGGGVSFATDPDGASVIVLTATSAAQIETDPDGTPVLVIGA